MMDEPKQSQMIMSYPSQPKNPPANYNLGRGAAGGIESSSQEAPSRYEALSKDDFVLAQKQEEAAAEQTGSLNRTRAFNLANIWRRRAEEFIRTGPMNQLLPYPSTKSGNDLFIEEATKLENRAAEAIARHDYDYAERLQDHADRLHFYIESYKSAQPDAQRERVLRHQQQYQQQ
jgi:hypothetical protein